MLRVETEFPLANNSLDHLFPEGVHYDNNVSDSFVDSVANFFNRKINFLDLGCAGGALTVRMHSEGHFAVGIDGSDGCLNPGQKSLDHFNGRLPLGYQNWNEYYNSILFTADITKDYSIVDENKIVEFDLITCWDVMEHFKPEQIENFLVNVKKHLKPSGIFIASIALFPSGSNIAWEEHPDINYHQSLFSKEEWLLRIEPHFDSIPYPFTCCNREYINLSDPTYLVFSGIKI